MAKQTRPHAKYFTRREAYALAASAFEAGKKRGQEAELGTYWNGNSGGPGADAKAFDEWREKHYPNLPAI